MCIRDSFKDPADWFAQMEKRGIVVSPNIKPGMLLVHPLLDEMKAVSYTHLKVDTRPELDKIIKKFKQDGYKIQYEPSSPVGGGEVRAVTFEDIVLEVNYTPAA